MLMIKCVCGFEIMILPDVSAMKRAIEKHSRSHPGFQKDLIESYLISQMLEKIKGLAE